jgi:thiol-disulfide isomerase/thioredoxin
MTVDGFVREMTKNRDIFDENYATFRLDDAEKAALRDLDMSLNVVVLAEDWCGDVLRYLPAFARMAEAAGNWNVRIFYRDENLDLIDRCLKEGKHRAIPVFLFYDRAMNELACLTEKPAGVYGEEAAARKRFADEHPDWPDASFYVDDMSEDTREAYITFIRAFRADNRLRWQRLFVQEILDKLKRARPHNALA